MPNVLRLCTQGDGEAAQVVDTNTLLLSRSVKELIRDFGPDVILFIPKGAMTLTSLARVHVLRSYGNGCPVALLSVQPKPLSLLGRTALRLLGPDLVLAQSHAEADNMRRLGCKAAMVPAGVDLDRFVPVDGGEKARLRSKHGFEPDDKVILHVGHLRENRNVRIFKHLQNLDGCKCVLVGSTRTCREEGLINELSDAGVRIVGDYQPNIEEWYQLADLYVFPVVVSDAAIQFPLSVLEALACNLPVVTTRFGGLLDMLPETDGLSCADNDDEIVSAVAEFDLNRSYSVRHLAEALSWDHITGLVLGELTAIVG